MREGEAEKAGTLNSNCEVCSPVGLEGRAAIAQGESHCGAEPRDAWKRY